MIGWSGDIWGRLWRNWVFVINGSLVLECITTVSYSILVNREPKEILCLHTFFCYAQKV